MPYGAGGQANGQSGQGGRIRITTAGTTSP